MPTNEEIRGRTSHFEIPHAGQTYKGTNSISLTSLRVKTDKALTYWKKRLEEYGIEHDGISDRSGRATLRFQDFEGQRLMLVSDEHNKGVPGGKPWDKSPVPVEYGIIGLGPITLTVAQSESTAAVLTDLLGFKETRSFPSDQQGQPDIRVFETGEGGTGAEVFLEERSDLPRKDQAGEAFITLPSG